MDNGNAVFIAGAGTMGTGIAQVCAVSGYRVRLYDVDPSQIGRAAAFIDKRLSSGVAKGKLSVAEKRAAMERIASGAALSEAAGCDVVIEAAAEAVEVKQALFREVERLCKPGALLATNTSSLSITQLAGALKHPERFVGLHFFNPVPVMKLVEITRGFATAPETLAAARAFGESLGKIVIVAKDGPGLLVNRMIDLMMNEAVELLDQGYGGVEDIDKGMVHGCGHPMGPLALADMIGLDILLAVMETMSAEFADPKYRPAPLLRKMVRAGYLGRKTGKGFYLYDAEPVPNPLFAPGAK